MSKAFTKEDDGGSPETPIMPHRAPLPMGVPNYVTPRGLVALRVELAQLESERERLEADASGAVETPRAMKSIDFRRRELETRIISAVLVTGQAERPDEVRFGARVEVRSPTGIARHYEIVGVDEADAAAGRVAFVAPMARALLGRSIGETVAMQTPRGEESLEILGIAYDDAAPL